MQAEKKSYISINILYGTSLKLQSIKKKLLMQKYSTRDKNNIHSFNKSFNRNKFVQRREKIPFYMPQLKQYCINGQLILHYNIQNSYIFKLIIGCKGYTFNHNYIFVIRVTQIQTFNSEGGATQKFCFHLSAHGPLVSKLYLMDYGHSKHDNTAKILQHYCGKVQYKKKDNLHTVGCFIFACRYFSSFA
eukprot:TRINITY_DN7238_c1_g2_i2.p2 TRINITY_DN7238_c1_g2~~TRINITY_DN7238_c1_g2_i2.p2  ORF type:complete len:189 (-),score=-8.83 TRINITY_DN7238_c1_g2_i2:665-1231(-)